MTTIIECGPCRTTGHVRRATHQSNPVVCDTCDGMGYMGIDPFGVCYAPPGHPLRVAILAARYRAGVLLWDERDVGATE